MNRLLTKSPGLKAAAVAAALILPMAGAQAAINGHMGAPGPAGPVFNIDVTDGFISIGDGGNVYMWGYGLDDASNPSRLMQYPGPTLIVNQGDVVTINLTNKLGATAPAAMPVSMIFPGQSNVAATGGIAGLLTQEADIADDPGTAANEMAVTYSFTAGNAGTYIYQSGTRQDIQIEMGLSGVLIVRPANFSHTVDLTNPDGSPLIDPFTGNVMEMRGNQKAYNHPGTGYDYEYLYAMTEIDPSVHETLQGGDWQNATVPPGAPAGTTVKDAQMQALNTELAANGKFHDVYWFINGRAFPDTVLPDGMPYLPTQPYGSFIQMFPGSKSLVRLVNIGRKAHPPHLHGNNGYIIAQDANVQDSNGDAVGGFGLPDLARSENTFVPAPGQTMDILWDWVPKNVGWNMFNSQNQNWRDVDNDGQLDLVAEDAQCVDARNNVTGMLGSDGFDDGGWNKWEWCADHPKPMPVKLPALADLMFGGFWGGSPFLGAFGELPVGEGGLNATGGFVHIWHSHTERELANNDAFPGGILTFAIVHPFVDPEGNYVTIPRGPAFDAFTRPALF